MCGWPGVIHVCAAGEHSGLVFQTCDACGGFADGGSTVSFWKTTDENICKGIDLAYWQAAISKCH